MTGVLTDSERLAWIRGDRAARGRIISREWQEPSRSLANERVCWNSLANTTAWRAS
jgi:hypothetical protein